MTLIIPAPPGEAVAFDDSKPARLAERSTRNLFVIGTFDRGVVSQFADVAGLRLATGPRVNYSPASDEVSTALAEGGATVTASRATGPAATVASVAINAKIKVQASSPGAWGAALTADLTAPTTDTRRLFVYEAGNLVSTSPVVTSMAELKEWASRDAYVRIVIDAPGLPVVTGTPVALTGGTDDRSSLSVAGWTAALAGLDSRYGPGRLIAPGVTDLSVFEAIVPHLAATNRIAELQLPPDVTEQQAAELRASLAADFPADHWRAALWASHAYATPIGSEPERLVGWASIQAGIASYVEGRYGVGAAPFGLRRGVSQTASRLYREWSTGFNPPGALQRLYAAHVNAAVDNGQLIYAKGYRTLDADPLREDMHVAGTRMRLGWAGLQKAESYLGEPADRTTLAEYHADLEAVCKDFVAAGAFNTDIDAGYRVDVDSVNTETTLQTGREIHGRIYFRPNGSTHWADVLVGAARPLQQI